MRAALWCAALLLVMAHGMCAEALACAVAALVHGRR